MSRILRRMGLSALFAGLLFAGFHFFEAAGLPAEEEKEDRKGKRMYEALPVPAQLSFAGEPVPLDYMDVYESLDRELMVNSYFHSQTLRLLKLAPRYFSVIEPLLKADTIPMDFKYLAVAESGFNLRALSPAGAAGIWQFLRGTAQDYGLEVNSEVDERYHMEKATRAACRYLKDSYRKYGNWTLVAASYNAGRNFMDRQIERQQQVDYYDLYLGEETGRYLFRILALKLILEDPEAYGFRVTEKETYPAWQTVALRISGPVPDFAAFAREHGTNYKILKMLNPWLRKNFLSNSGRKTYVLQLPGPDGRKFNEFH
ncbi:MAG: lytic transglycosylase domain-containing protein [Mangrovibacterium sp.]